MSTDDEITRIFPRRQIRLADLEPRWLDDGVPVRAADGRVQHQSARYGLGVSMLCPGHLSAEHRVELWFLNPMDTEPPIPRPCLYYRTGDTFEDLTLVTSQTRRANGYTHYEVISVSGHWAGYVHGGYVIDALRLAGW